MIYKILSNLVVIVHLLFIVFVCLGALFVIKWPKLIWIHIPFALWGVIVEYLNIVCPLTPLENYLRHLCGTETYEADFIDQYIIPLIYPEVLTRNLQFILGSFVLILNFTIYGFIIYRKLKQKSVDDQPCEK